MLSAARLAVLIARHGRSVTLQLAGVGGAWTSVSVLAHVAGYDAKALVTDGTVQQGDREVRIAQAALDAAGASRAPRQGDRLVVDGKSMAVLSVDARALTGTTALLVLRVRGA
jgi:hypothetical protein